MKTISFNKKVYTPSKIVCVGKNFFDHVKEMGGRDLPSEPVIFIKPNSSLVFFQTKDNHRKIFVPQEWGLLHHEIEICFLVGKTCSNIAETKAKSFIAGYGIGIDLTLRDRQAEAKKNGNPWTICKGFDDSAVIGEFADPACVPDSFGMKMSLKVNGKIFQDGNAKDMIFSPFQILSYASRFMTIELGDIFMCGTPSGVGPLNDKDLVEAKIEKLRPLTFEVVRSTH